MIDVRTVWRLCLVCVLVGVLGLILTWQASAHEWFEYRCCSGMDCRTLPPGFVKVTPKGYAVTIPGGPTHIIPFNDRRVRMIPETAPAEDLHNFHACTVGGKPTGDVICLYVPSGGA